MTAEQISFTLAFKEEFWRLGVEGCTGNIARLGYDPEVLGFERVHNITKRTAAPSWKKCPARRASGAFRTRSYTSSSRWRFLKSLCGSLASRARSGDDGAHQLPIRRHQGGAGRRPDFQLILNAYRFRGYDKGARGIHMRLLHTGIRMNSNLDAYTKQVLSYTLKSLAGTLLRTLSAPLATGSTTTTTTGISGIWQSCPPTNTMTI